MLLGALASAPRLAKCSARTTWPAMVVKWRGLLPRPLVTCRISSRHQLSSSCQLMLILSFRSRTLVVQKTLKVPRNTIMLNAEITRH